MRTHTYADAMNGIIRVGAKMTFSSCLLTGATDSITLTGVQNYKEPVVKHSPKIQSTASTIVVRNP